MVSNTAQPPEGTTETHRRVAAHDVLWNVELIEQIFSYTSPSTFFCFAKTCKTAKLLVREWVMREFDINRRLSPFFDDPRSFRALQAKTGALIFGLFALDLFLRTGHQESQLDLYAASGEELEIGQYLEQAGYVYTPCAGEGQTTSLFAEQVALKGNRLYLGRSSLCYTFSRGDIAPAVSSHEVKLFVAIGEDVSPVQQVLQGNYTCALNVISHQHAYSLFPLATVEMRMSLYLNASRIRNCQVLEANLKERGVKIVRAQDSGLLFPRSLDRTVFNKDASGPVGSALAIPGHGSKTPTRHGAQVPFQLGSRWLDDGHSWVVDLDMSWFEISSIRTDSRPVRCSNFALLYDPRKGFHISCFLGKSLALRYPYVMSDLEWCEALCKRLRACQDIGYDWICANSIVSEWRNSYIAEMSRRRLEPLTLRFGHGLVGGPINLDQQLKFFFEPPRLKWYELGTEDCTIQTSYKGRQRQLRPDELE